MKLRNKVAAVAAGAGLLAGMVAVGTTSPAGADDNVLLTCTNAVGDAKITPGLTDTAQSNVVAGKLAKGASAAPCTGPLASAYGISNAPKLSAKLLNQTVPGGGVSCVSANNTDSVSGKLSVTYDAINPVTLKAYSSSAFVRLGTADPAVFMDAPDAFGLDGIVTKGVGAGGFVGGGILQQPYVAKSVGFPIPPALQPYLGPGPYAYALPDLGTGTMNPLGGLSGFGSALLGLACTGDELPSPFPPGLTVPYPPGVSAITNAYFGTTGYSLDPNIVDPIAGDIHIAVPAPEPPA